MSFFKHGVLIERAATTATSTGTLTLTASSRTFQQLTGTSNHTVVLPNATTLSIGQKYVLQNRSTGTLTVQASGGAFLASVLPNSERSFQVQNISTAAGVWDITTGAAGAQDTPLRMYGAPTPSALLHFAPSNIRRPDGTALILAPVNSQTPSVVASTVNMQTQETTGTTFDITWPTSTIGQYRRLAFVVKSDGTIVGTFSEEEGSVGALPDPGEIYDPSGEPLGYVDLEATAVTPAFKTAGSATDVVQNTVNGIPRIFNVVSRGAGGGFAGSDTIENEESEPTPITGMVLNSAAMSSALVHYTIRRVTDSEERVETCLEMVSFLPVTGTWERVPLGVGPHLSGVTLTITAGQYYYISDEITGTPIIELIEFRVYPLGSGLPGGSL